MGTSKLFSPSAGRKVFVSAQAEAALATSSVTRQARGGGGDAPAAGDHQLTPDDEVGGEARADYLVAMAGGRAAQRDLAACERARSLQMKLCRRLFVFELESLLDHFAEGERAADGMRGARDARLHLGTGGVGRACGRGECERFRRGAGAAAREVRVLCAERAFRSGRAGGSGWAGSSGCSGCPGETPRSGRAGRSARAGRAEACRAGGAGCPGGASCTRRTGRSGQAVCPGRALRARLRRLNRLRRSLRLRRLRPSRLLLRRARCSAAPVAPLTPLAPGASRAPVGPVEPVGPVTPVGPVAPDGDPAV